MCKELKGADEMTVTIKKIIRVENSAADDFMRDQRRKRANLLKKEKWKKEGCNVKVDSIISKLQRAGILDENGNLAAPYNGED